MNPFISPILMFHKENSSSTYIFSTQVVFRAITNISVSTATIFLRQTIYHSRCLDRACDDFRSLRSCALTRFRSSSRFPFNFNPLHFKHRFNWSTAYSGSLSNFDPRTPSSSVRTVKDCRALLAIRIIFPYFSYRIELCLSESRGGLKCRAIFLR